MDDVLAPVQEKVVTTAQEKATLPLPGKEYLEHLKKVNDVFYDQSKMADQKAAYIFSFMIAVLITSPEGRAAFQWQQYIGGDLLTSLVSAVMAVASTVALVAAILTIAPRRGKRTSTLFWGAWDLHRQELVTAANAGDPNYLFEQYLTNIDSLSAIVRAKYRFSAIALRSLVVMVFAYVGLLVLARI